MTNRSRGDYLERQTRAALEQYGWEVIRAAGSHGIADLWAARAGNTLLWISCKIDGQIPPDERAALLERAQRAGARAVCAYRTQRGYVDIARVELTSFTSWTLLDQIKVPTIRKDEDDDSS